MRHLPHAVPQGPLYPEQKSKKRRLPTGNPQQERAMPKLKRGIVPALLTATIAGLALTPLPAGASSHREAPVISQDPTADNTDVYAYTHGSNVVLVANYIGLEQPASGPNFHRFGDDVLYQIHVDNVGDGRSHVAFSFNFQTQNFNDPLGNDTFLYNFGPISAAPSPPGVNPYKGWLRPQTYSVKMSRQGGESTDEDTDEGESGFQQGGLYTAPDAVGKVSTGSGGKYNHALTNAAVYSIGPGSASAMIPSLPTSAASSISSTSPGPPPAGRTISRA
jgi:hypothetical protein